MNKFLIFATLLCLSYSLKTVDELDLNSYLGYWYEVVSSPFVHLTFEKGGHCSRATYSLNDDGTIHVRNQQREGSPEGPVTFIEGFAYQPKPEDYPGKLKVNFNKGFEGNYWVLELGPIVDDQYQWVVVSEPRKLFMWVLARDPYNFQELYGEEVKNLVVNQFGFKGAWHKYITRSWEGCLPYQ